MTPVEVIWLTEERVHGLLLNMGAHYSTVKYTKNGMEYQVLIENNEFNFIDEQDDDNE